MNLLEKFEIYHAENPVVYELFKEFARKARNAGFDSYSSKAIFERLRWHMNIETKGDPFKLNNNYTSFYARMMMDDLPAYNTFFNTREQRNLTDAQIKQSGIGCSMAQNTIKKVRVWMGQGL